MKAQGSTEYLVTLGAILFIGLIVSVVLFWPVGTTKDVKQSQTDVKYKIQAMNPASLKTGLVAYWKFDEGSGSTVSDSSGSNNGTLVNGPTWVSGKTGSALQFDGVNDYVNFGAPSALNLGTGDFTLAAWINPASAMLSTTNREFCILGNSQSDWARGAYIEVSTWGGKAFNSYVNGIGMNVAGLTLEAGNWYHVVLTRNSSTMKIYVNGAYTGTRSNAAIAGNATYQDWRVGYPEPGAYYFNGKIDEAMIYSRALSSDEVELLYTVPNVLKSDSIFNMGTP